MLTRAIIFGSVVFAASSVLGEVRMEFAALDNGSALSEAEVCFYPYEFYHPLRNLRSPAYRCLQADVYIAAPVGQSFAYFMRNSDGLISGNPIIYEAPPGASGFRSFAFPMKRGAVIDVKSLRAGLARDERIALIFGGSREAGPYVAPVSDDEVLVPAEGVVLPVVVADGAIQRAAEPITPARGGRTVAQMSHANVVVLRVVATNPETGNVDLPDNLCARPWTKETATMMEKQPPPLVELVDSSGRRIQPVLAPATTGHLLTGVYAFSGAAQGSATVAISGERWVASSEKLVVSEGVTVVERPFAATLGGEVRAIVEPQVADVAYTAGRSCEQQNDSAPVLRLDHCGESGCTAGRAVAFDEKGAVFSGVPHGFYQLRLLSGERELAREGVNVDRGATVVVEMNRTTTPRITGIVTSGGLPVRGTVMFRTGRGVTDAEGRFAILVAEEPGTAPVRFSTCDTTVFFSHRPEAPLRDGDVLYLQIPDEELLIRLVDDRTDRVVRDADAMVAVLEERDESIVQYFTGGIPQNDGSYLVKSLEKGRRYRVCAEHQDYPYRCAEKSAIKGEGLEEATLRLTPRSGRSGRVLAPGYRTLYWTTGVGDVTEYVEVLEDGTFTYEKPHSEGERIVVVGSAPLALAHATAGARDGQIDVHVTAPSSKSVDLRIAPENPQQSGLVALWIDGVRIPPDALAMHQLMRKSAYLIRERQPLVITDLAGQTIHAALGPDPSLLAGGTSFSSPSLFAGVVPRDATSGTLIFRD